MDLAPMIEHGRPQRGDPRGDVAVGDGVALTLDPSELGLQRRERWWWWVVAQPLGGVGQYGVLLSARKEREQGAGGSSGVQRKRPPELHGQGLHGESLEALDADRPGAPANTQETGHSDRGDEGSQWGQGCLTDVQLVLDQSADRHQRKPQAVRAALGAAVDPASRSQALQETVYRAEWLLKRGGEVSGAGVAAVLEGAQDGADLADELEAA